MNKSPKNVLKEKSYAFALRSINLHKYLSIAKKEYVLSKQLLRSGTSIGANVTEANHAQSRADFISKLAIALKEAAETEYWINLLRDSKYLTAREAESMTTDCVELIKLLTASLKTSRTTRH